MVARAGRGASPDQDWVLLAYRLPRVPSTPRSTLWRKLKRLGVVQLADGLVALPADASTREALEWLADEVIEFGGEATVWLGRPADAAGRSGVVERMRAAVQAEYEAVIAEVAEVADADVATRRRVGARLRRELHRIEARDFFAAPAGQTARRVIRLLGADQPVAVRR